MPPSLSQGHLYRRDWFLSRYQGILVAAIGFWLLGVSMAAYQALATETGDLLFPAWTSWQALLCWTLVFSGLLLLIASRVSAIVLACAVFLLFGGAYYRTFHLQPGLQDVYHAAKGYPVRIVGECFLQSDEPSKAYLNVQSVNTQPYHGKALVRLNRSLSPPQAGSLVMFEGRLSKPADTTIPGAFDERRYLASQGVTAVLHHVNKLETLHEEPVSLAGALNRHLAGMRTRIAGIFKEALPTPLSQIVGGIVLGDQAIPLDTEVKQRFVRTGLIHLLAASGMNVAIVSGLLFYIARLVVLPRRGQLLLAMSGALLYAFLSGMSPSVLRATAMLEIALGLKFIDKSLSNISVLMLAVAAIILWRPDLISSIGFQLSVLTTLGIMAMLPPLQRWVGYYWGDGIAGALLLPLIAQLWATPLLMFYFNELPVLGVALNIVVIPVVAALTCLGFGAGVLGLFLGFIGVWIAKITYPFVWALYAIVRVTADWPGTQLHVSSPSTLGLFSMYAALLALALLLNRHGFEPSTILNAARGVVRKFKRVLVPKRLRLSVAALLLLLAAGLWFYKSTYLMARVSALPLNAENAAYILEESQWPGGFWKTSVKNPGQNPVLLLPWDASPWYTRRVADYLRHRNVQKLSALYWYGERAQQVESTAQTLSARQKAVLKMLSARLAIETARPLPSGYSRLGEAWRVMSGDAFWTLHYKDSSFCLGALNPDNTEHDLRQGEALQKTLNTLCPHAYQNGLSRRFAQIQLLGLPWRPANARWRVVAGG